MIVSAPCDLEYAKLADLEVERASTARDWLSEDELVLWHKFRAASRRDTFLAGRILAKRLLRKQQLAASRVAPSRITIRSDAASQGVRPWVLLDGHRLAYALSISHTSDAVLVGGTNRFGISVGVDLVPRRPLGAPFERSWLTEAESTCLRENGGETTVADIWAMKEAVFKAVHHGEPFAPRCVEIRLEAERRTVFYHGRNLGDRCQLRVRRLGNQVAAVATYQRLGTRSQSPSELHVSRFIPSEPSPYSLRFFP